MRGRRRKYVEIENKLVQYLYLRSHKYSQYKCGVRWIFMENKCLKFVEGLGINDFKASPCCISATLKRNNKVAIDFPVESNYMTYEDMEIIMLSWCKYFYINIKEVYTPTECVYNAEKTGLYYKKLPNHAYIDKANKNDYTSVNQIKDKTHITLMVVSSTSEKKCHLLYLENRKPQNDSN